MPKMTSSEIDDAVDNTVRYFGRLAFKLLQIAAVLFVVYWAIAYSIFIIWL